jgi:hypothetical protein
MTIFGSGNVHLGSQTDSGFKFYVSGTGKFTDTLQFSAGDRGLECSGSSGVSFYSNEINSGSQGVAGDLYLGYRRTNRTYIMSALTVNSAATFNSSITMTNPIGITGDLQAIKLRAGSSTGYSYLRFYNSGDASRFYMGLFNSGGIDYGLIDGSGYRFEIAGSPIVLNNNGYNVLIGTSTDSGYKLDVNGTGRFQGTLQSDNATTAELRLRGGGYGASYNTSLRSVTGAAGILQFGNNGDNYVLIGNTATGGYLDFRSNVSSESISSGSPVLRLYANQTAYFWSSVTATSFFESSDFRLKTLIEHNPIIEGIEKLQSKLYEKNGKIEIGYFAQDAQRYIPYAVTKGTDGFLSLSYREVHTAKIARLEQRVAELEKQLNVA